MDKIHIKEYDAVKFHVNNIWIIRGWFIFGNNFNVLYYGASINFNVLYYGASINFNVLYYGASINFNVLYYGASINFCQSQKCCVSFFQTFEKCAYFQQIF